MWGRDGRDPGWRTAGHPKTRWSRMTRSRALRRGGAGRAGVMLSVRGALRDKTGALEGRVCAKRGHSEASVKHCQEHKESAGHFARDHNRTYARRGPSASETCEKEQESSLAEVTRKLDVTEWSGPGSNRRPPACKAGALPAELPPRRTARQKLTAKCRRAKPPLCSPPGRSFVAVARPAGGCLASGYL